MQSSSADRAIICVGISLAVLAAANQSFATTPVLVPVVEFASPNPPPFSNFGWSVSLDGPLALVSSNHNDRAGQVAIYRDAGMGNWIGAGKLIHSDSHVGDTFGWSTALDGSTALVGAPRYGAVYVFENGEGDQWREVAVLKPTGPVPSYGVGYSVSLSESSAVVGASGEALFQGAAYVFERDQHGAWRQTVRLKPIGTVGAAQFGGTVSLSDDTALIGALHDNNLNGAAYVFRRDHQGSWNQIARITPNGAAGQTYFGGGTLSPDGRTALIGAPGTAELAGAAFVFREYESGNWSQIANLAPLNSHVGQQFGSSVAISGSIALVGAGVHSVYVFQEDELGQWSQIAELARSQNSADYGFGYSIALDGSRALVSDLFNNRNGAAYLYQIPEPPSFLIAAIPLLVRMKQIRKWWGSAMSCACSGRVALAN